MLERAIPYEDRYAEIVSLEDGATEARVGSESYFFSGKPTDYPEVFFISFNCNEELMNLLLSGIELKEFNGVTIDGKVINIVSP